MIKNLHILVFTCFFSLNAIAQNTIDVNCQNLFLSGTNLAWNQFGGDVGFSNNPNLTYFNTFFANVNATGGNSVRWWLHTDASFTPELETNGNCTGLHKTLTNEEIIGQIRDVLDKAWDNSILVTISLFSFDMLQDPTNKGWTNINYLGNKAFLQLPTNVQSYIDNALTPMVNALKDHPALAFWEIFNEPEGMTSEFGWTGNQGGTFISMANVQMVVNKLTGAIHDADPNARVTNGTWSLKVNTNVGNGNINYYSDNELVAAGGTSNGTLDFYQVHYYDWQDNQNPSISPFEHNKDYWQLDKQLMLGEFYATQAAAVLGVTDDSVYDWIYQNGYFGAWAWQYNESDLWNAMKPQIIYMETTNPTTVEVDKNACSSLGINDQYTEDANFFPNPANNEIKVNNTTDVIRIQIFTVLGEELVNQKLVGNFVDISELSIGIYIVKFSTSTGYKSTKLIKY